MTEQAWDDESCYAWVSKPAMQHPMRCGKPASETVRHKNGELHWYCPEHVEEMREIAEPTLRQRLKRLTR